MQTVPETKKGWQLLVGLIPSIPCVTGIRTRLNYFETLTFGFRILILDTQGTIHEFLKVFKSFPD